MVEPNSYVYFVLCRKIDDLSKKRTKLSFASFVRDDHEFLYSYYSERIQEIQLFLKRHFPNADDGDFTFIE